MTLVDDGFGCSKTEPRGRVAKGEYPDANCYIFGPSDSTYAVRFHWTADGNVALNCERSQTQR